jgi:hypothetical protein
MFAVIVATFARRLKRDRRRRCCFCTAKKRNCGNYDSGPRHCARSYHFVIAVGRAKETQSGVPMKFWEIIADNLSKAGWSWGCVSTVDSNGQTIWSADAHSSDGSRKGTTVIRSTLGQQRHA